MNSRCSSVNCPLDSNETFVVDPKNHRLIGNPENGGEWIMDVF